MAALSLIAYDSRRPWRLGICMPHAPPVTTPRGWPPPGHGPRPGRRGRSVVLGSTAISVCGAWGHNVGPGPALEDGDSDGDSDSDSDGDSDGDSGFDSDGGSDPTMTRSRPAALNSKPAGKKVTRTGLRTLRQVTLPPPADATQKTLLYLPARHPPPSPPAGL